MIISWRIQENVCVKHTNKQRIFDKIMQNTIKGGAETFFWIKTQKKSIKDRVCPVAKKDNLK